MLRVHVYSGITMTVLPLSVLPEIIIELPSDST